MSQVITVRLHERGGNKSLFGEDEYDQPLRAAHEAITGDEVEAAAGDDIQQWLRGLLTVAGRRRCNWGN
jgi:hypothetical protein